MRISDWSSDVCSSDLLGAALFGLGALGRGGLGRTDGVGSVANRDGDHGLLLSALRAFRDQSAPHDPTPVLPAPRPQRAVAPAAGAVHRSEEHTSELQSLMRISYAVFCLKKKKITYTTTPY